MDAYEEFWWADRFGWTPEQTDELGVVQARRLRVLTGAIDEGRAKRAKEDLDSKEQG